MTEFELAKYEREWPSFEEIFGVTASQVITGMNQSGDDIPEQKPNYALNIQAAGVTRTNIPVKILHPFDSRQVVQIVCSLVANTEVPSYKRGIHMSRIGDIIANSTTYTYANLQEYTEQIAESLSKLEYQGLSQVKAFGQLPYLEKVKGWIPEKNKLSLEHIGLTASSVTNKGNGYKQSAGITISNITACPCVQSTYKHTLLQKGYEDIEKQIVTPLITHSQRCKTTIEILDLPRNSVLPIKDLIASVDQGIVRVQNTLPREHELLMVYQAHKKPQFIKNVVREMAFKTYQVVKNDFHGSSIRVYSESMESIHDFDIQAEFKDSIENLKKAWN